MLSQAEQKRIRSLQTKKGRRETGLCLVEGEKVIQAAASAIVERFDRNDVESEAAFLKLVTTESPQEQAAIARIPEAALDDLMKKEVIVVLDGVQDPGNVGAILRLCLGFRAGLILIESADVTSSKVIRSSVGAMFQVPWMVVPRGEAEVVIASLDRPVYRLEKRDGSEELENLKSTGPIVLIAGSEGGGIQLPAPGTSIAIKHASELESLNVGHALAIVLHHLQRSLKT